MRFPIKGITSKPDRSQKAIGIQESKTVVGEKSETTQNLNQISSKYLEAGIPATTLIYVQAHIYIYA